MADRVRIGSCTGPADAALVRAMFAAHDIHAVVGGEHHAAMLGGLGGGFLSLDIYVSAEDAEQAAELLAELRAQNAELPDEVDPEEEEAEIQGSAVPLENRIAQRRAIGIALLLAFCITLGTAHLSTRAWKRGLALAAIEIFGFTQLVKNPIVGGLLVAGSVIADAVGSIWRIRTRYGRPELPAARTL